MIISCVELPVHLFYERKYLIPSHLLDSARNKMLGQELPGRAHPVQEIFDILAHRTLILLVGFREHETEGDIPFPQSFQKLQVYLLRAMPAVDEYEHGDEVFSFTQVVLDHLFPSSSFGLRDLCKAVAGQVHDVPFVIDIKVVDQLRLAGRTGSLRQLIIADEHIDKGRFADVASSDKSVFGPVRRRALRMIRAADDVGGGTYDHECLLTRQVT